MTDGGGGGRVLHLIWDPEDQDATFLVSPATLERARTAPYPEEPPTTFGELRCADDLDELERQLGRAGIDDLDVYVTAIERSAGREPGTGDLEARLRTVRDVDFHGLDVESDDDLVVIPGDRNELDLQSWDIWAEPYWRVIYDAMRDSDDIPADLRELHVDDREGGSPLWWGRLYTTVIPGHLEELISELERRRYTIARESHDAP